MAPVLTLDSVDFAYGDTAVCRRLAFQLDQGTVAALLGPSGCGKTTALRLIAGFLHTRSGRISIGGRVVCEAGRCIPPEARQVGVVFQDYALFPHLTVARNIAFGLSHPSRTARNERVDEMLELTRLGDLRDAYPHELSGGQQQRVALARALAPRPKLLLLDEPFSNLDVDLREQLSFEVRELLKREQTTALVVTHDQFEAFSIADEVGVMHTGRIEQWATPYDLYHRPATRFVADFIGQGALIRGRMTQGNEIECEFGRLHGADDPHLMPGADVDLLLRPDDILHDDASPVQARVVHKAFRGAQILYTLALDSGQEVLSLVPSHHNHALGEKIGIRTDISHVVAFARDARAAEPSPAQRP